MNAASTHRRLVRGRVSRFGAALIAAVVGLAAMASPLETVAGEAPAAAEVHYGAWGVDLTARDLSVAPGDDFYRYATGAWSDRAVISDDEGATGSGRDVYDRTQARLRELIEGAARTSGSPEQAKIGDLYAAFMDEARLDRLDDAPLRPLLARIAAIPDKPAFSRLMAHTYGDFGRSLFGLAVGPDPDRPGVYALYLDQDGLGLPDRDYYLTDGFKPQKIAYRAYVERTLSMIGYPNAAVAASDILAFETRIARASWSQAEERDVVKASNPMTVAALQAMAPGLDWRAHLDAAGAGGQTRVIVGPKGAIAGIAAVYAATPLATLKAWESFHTTDGAAPYLSRRFDESQFELHKALNGVLTEPPRWRRGVSLIDSALGDALGRAYVAAYFPPASKVMMTGMVANLKSALAARIKAAPWMAASTRAEALNKLAVMNVQVGYPDVWRDYAGLVVARSDLFGDVERSDAFDWAYQLADLGRGVDHRKWIMTPQTVNAYNGGLENKIVFPAGLLQPPFFDPAADPAVNYGAAGAIIGHEITHGFDDQGRRIDAAGALRDWWTPRDSSRFDAATAKYAAQFGAYEPVKGSRVDGRLTLGENIADLGGLLAALDAYHASLRGREAPVLDGLTGDQRFFLAFAQANRSKEREDVLRGEIATDSHAPAKFRVIGPLRNIDAWYAAFHVEAGRAYYLPPDDRVRIW